MTCLVYMQVAKANRAVESEVRGSTEGVGLGSGVHDQLLAQPSMCEQFVGLLCQFEAQAVLPFLQSHDTYRCNPAPTPTVPAIAS